MAMAMATILAAAGARILSPVSRSSSTNASCASTSSSSSSLAHLCSSFKGLSVQTWQKGGSRHGGDISGLSGISSAPNVSPTTTTRKLVFTVAKMKTHKASAKRFKVTGSGKIMRRQAYKQHLLRKKNSNRKRRLSKVVQVNRCDYDNVIGALPYLKVKGRLT